MTRKKTRLGQGTRAPNRSADGPDPKERGEKKKRKKRKKKRGRPKRTVIAGTPKSLAEAGASNGSSRSEKRGASRSLRATRSARLPPAPSDSDPPRSTSPKGSTEPASVDEVSADEVSADEVSANEAATSSSPEGTDDPVAWMSEQHGTARAVGKTKPGEGAAGGGGTRRVTRTTRPTLINRISRLSMDVAGRTTILELATLADAIAVETKSRVPPRFGFKVFAAAVSVATAFLVVTGALAIGRWRWIPLVFLFLSFVALIGWAALRVLPRIALRFGSREIPGRAAAWITLGFGIVAAGSWGITYAVSAAAEEVGQAVWPAMAPYMPDKLAALEKEEPPAPAPRKRRKTPRKARKKWVSPGVLFVPRTFEIVDGKFDLILFFHGNPDIVSEAVPQAGINALVHVTNLGLGSRPYQSKYLVPNSMLELVGRIERALPKVGLPAGLKARRVALAAWSAGYGALHSMLSFEPQRERVDAILMLDGIHGGFRPNTKRGVDPSTIGPFAKFAARAIANEKLMVITHSAILTHEYSSTTESADALLEELEMTRMEVDEDTSPPRVKFKAAVNAFPVAKRRWLRARSEAHAGNFHIYGYAGTTKEDHIAQLAQMSVTVLPMLKARWSLLTVK